jgi:hypothetical protein
MRVGDASMRDGKITTDAIEEKRPSKIDKSDRSRPAEVARIDEGPSPFERILRGLGREVDRGETLVRRATTGAGSGQELGSMELLALQAGVYRYSEAVDLSAKLVDRAASGVKTVLQGQ